MPRREARIFTSIWKDRDVRALPMMARFIYTFLIEQEDLTHCGVIPLRVARWSDLLDERTEDELTGDLDALEKHRFIVTDSRTGELFVRSLVRRDKVLRQPFLFPALAESAGQIQSPQIRAALVTELCRVRDSGDVNGRIAGDLDELITSLSGDDPGTHPDRHPDRDSGRHPDTHPDRHPQRQPDSRPGCELGEGVRNGGSVAVAPIPNPHPPTPQPHPRAGMVPLWPHADTDEEEGEGSSAQNPAPAEVAELVAEVRVLRPEWATQSIKRALKHPSVRERGWELARAALLVVAADPESQAPGRLAHDGPWWHRAPPAPAAQPLPTWCGDADCDERSRMRVQPSESTPNYDKAIPCPACHPSKVRTAS